MITITSNTKTSVTFNDEYGVHLNAREMKKVEIPKNTKELNMDVNLGGVRGAFKIKRVKDLKEIKLKLHQWGMILFGVQPTIDCKAVFADGTELDLLDKKTGSEKNLFAA